MFVLLNVNVLVRFESLTLVTHFISSISKNTRTNSKKKNSITNIQGELFINQFIKECT